MKPTQMDAVWDGLQKERKQHASIVTELTEALESCIRVLSDNQPLKEEQVNAVILAKTAIKAAQLAKH